MSPPSNPMLAEASGLVSSSLAWLLAASSAAVCATASFASTANSGRPPEACSRMAGVMVMASWMPCACFSASAARSPVPPGARLALRRGIQLATQGNASKTRGPPDCDPPRGARFQRDQLQKVDVPILLQATVLPELSVMNVVLPILFTVAELPS